MTHTSVIKNRRYKISTTEEGEVILAFALRSDLPSNDRLLKYDFHLWVTERELKHGLNYARNFIFRSENIIGIWPATGFFEKQIICINNRLWVDFNAFELDELIIEIVYEGRALSTVL